MWALLQRPSPLSLLPMVILMQLLLTIVTPSTRVLHCRGRCPPLRCDGHDGHDGKEGQILLNIEREILPNTPLLPTHSTKNSDLESRDQTTDQSKTDKINSLTDQNIRL